MDRIDRYRQAVRESLLAYAAIPFSHGEIECQPIFDTQRDRYQIINIGWDINRRVHGCCLHLDIIDGKIWIQHNSTEKAIGEELVERGIPREDIVLGFQAPEVRPYTKFGVA